MSPPESKPDSASWLTRKAFLVVFGTLFAVLFLIVLVQINIATQMDDIEERLAYRTPGPQIDQAAWPKTDIHRQTVYVPSYSHIYYKGGRPFLLETTLSIRNTDAQHEIAVDLVRYYDTPGRLIKDFLNEPLRLPPLASMDFLVKADDVSGGSGANFIVEWSAPEKVTPPLIEAVMVGIEGQNSISFVRSGIVLQSE